MHIASPYASSSAVQPLFNPRIPLAKLYTDALAQESNGIGSPAHLEESGSPRAAGRSGSHGERHGPVRTRETLLEQTDYTTLHYNIIRNNNSKTHHYYSKNMFYE